MYLLFLFNVLNLYLLPSFYIKAYNLSLNSFKSTEAFLIITLNLV